MGTSPGQAALSGRRRLGSAHTVGVHTLRDLVTWSPLKEREAKICHLQLGSHVLG